MVGVPTALGLLPAPGVQDCVGTGLASIPAVDGMDGKPFPAVGKSDDTGREPLRPFNRLGGIGAVAAGWNLANNNEGRLRLFESFRPRATVSGPFVPVTSD